MVTASKYTYDIKQVSLKEIENLKMFWLYSGTLEDAVKKFETKFGKQVKTAYILSTGTVYIPVESEE